MDAVKPAKPTYVGSKKRRKMSTGSLKEGQQRSISEGRKRSVRRPNVSRDSSTGSSAISLDVRCACQYFQSDSLLPDRINPMSSRPNSRVSNTIIKYYGDHDYEPVNPPPDNVSPVSTAKPTVHIIDTDRGQQTISHASNSPSFERRRDITETNIIESQNIPPKLETQHFEKVTELQTAQIPTVTTITTNKTTTKSEGPGKFQQVIKTQADKIKTKLHDIKKPNIKLPSKPNIKKPNFENFKFEKPKISLPKLPDTAKISLPTFSLPRKTPLKRSLKQRQHSTESNAGGSKKNYFDFRTYPRLFKKKTKDDLDSFSTKSEREESQFATVPRTKRNKKDDDRWGGQDSIRIPLHGEDSFEDKYREDSAEDKDREDSVEDRDREGSVEERMASHARYEQDIDDVEDAYERENQEIHAASPFSHNFNSRWNHGSFHPQEYPEETRNEQITDLDSPDEIIPSNGNFQYNINKDIHSSESSLGLHRRGVLEEIDSDEFFLRQKGISQDNIEVGMYLSSEIREAFKSPSNALADLQKEPGYSYEVRTLDQSLPEIPAKRKSAKKPKRKKTPHVSREQVSFDSEFDTEFPPARPKRKSKKNKKQAENIITYRETIDIPDTTFDTEQPDQDSHCMYENEGMQGKELPEIRLTDYYDEDKMKSASDEEVFTGISKPEAPPRKHKSLKSLNYSEHDSIIGDVDPDRDLPFDNMEIYKTEHEYIIPTPDDQPIKPRRTTSHSSSMIEENTDFDQVPTRPRRTISRSSSKSYGVEESIEPEEIPIRPTRTRSQSRTRTDSALTEEPCVEEICVQDFRDSMGYAVIDKNIKRDPPLPPSRTPPRTPPRGRRSIHSIELDEKFSTVPRTHTEETPVRPLRNYSTLGPNRPPRRKQPVNMTDEEKENIDISQYIEIEDEPNRDLQSGKVIEKMRDRPLPAPPRPPRKTRTLQDIVSDDNRSSLEENIEDGETKLELLEEAEVSTQTEPLPDDFLYDDEVPVETAPVEENKPIVIERHLITPTNYTFEETITHGSLIVEPLNGAKILPDSEFSQVQKPVERNIPISKEYEDETSEIPEEFTKLKDPEPNPPVPESSETGLAQAPVTIVERIIERPVLVKPDINSEVEVLKAQKLQVSDLDVDRLSVNELLASKIIVSEIDSGNIQANEISSRSGALKVGEIELPPSLVEQLFQRLQSVVQEQQTSVVKPTSAIVEEKEETGQKKTPIEEVVVETLPPQRPPRKTEENIETSASYVEKPEEAIETSDIPVEAIDTPQSLEVETIQTESLHISENEEIIPSEENIPPKPPVRTESSMEVVEPTSSAVKVEQEIPQRPPRHTEKLSAEETQTVEEDDQSPSLDAVKQTAEQNLNEEPPPRPPEPSTDYIPSQPPASFYALRAQQYVDNVEGDIPMVPTRRRYPKVPISRSSSDESPVLPPARRRVRSPEPSIPQLTGQLFQACGSAVNSSVKRLIAHITNVLQNSDGQQDAHVMIIILLVLIAGLILLGYGGKTVHYHHWEFFNPPRDM